MDGETIQRAPYCTLVTCLGEATPGGICVLPRTLKLPSSESPSFSMASISSEGSTESPIVEQEEIAALTHDVRTFKEALGKLKRVFSQEKERLDSLRVSAHERLSEVLRILRSVLERYSPLQSSELLSAAGTLIQHVKGYNYEDDKADPKEFFEFIDQLALAFSSRVSEYLMGDIDIHVPTSISGSVYSKTKSCENIASDVEDPDVSIDGKRLGWLSPQQLDDILLNLERGVEYSLHRAKLWSKYTKDIITYVEKRANTELEFAKNMIELCQSIHPLLTEEDYLPLQSLYCAAVVHDLENSRSTQMTCSLLLGNQFLVPLSLRRNELERTRKFLKETWQKELKKMHDVILKLRKSRSVYIQWKRELMKDAAIHARAGEEGLQAPDPAEQLDKRQCLEVDAVHKAFEAESAYRAAIAEANEHHLDLQKVKVEILHQVRELIIKCDQTIKTVTVDYFQLQHTLLSPIPIQFQTLHESSKLYEPGLKYMEFVKQLPSGTSKNILRAPFVFEPYQEGTALLPERKSVGTAMEGEDLGQDKNKLGGEVIAKSWGTVMNVGIGSDTDSISSSPSSKSQDTSPTASPMMPSRKLISVSSGDELENDRDTDFIAFEPTVRQHMSKAAITHNFRKLKTPSRCRECDTYVYFQGADCSECGLACHKKCLETLAIQCGHKRLPRKMTTFGVELGQYLKETSAQVPYIVCKCVNEIDERGKFVKGVYRVSGVKSKVEKLCQAFENGVDLVDLTGIHPNVIANVLKLYLRQLPEPLLTFRLYSDFVRIAKDFPSSAMYENKDPIGELKVTIKKLPKHHYATLALLMQHLKKVSEVSEINKMPASNLGIVFGPTLLRTPEGSASLNSLVDTVHQTRAVELIIIHANDIFGAVEFPVADYKIMETHHISRSSSSIANCKGKRVDKDQEVCQQALKFEMDIQEEALPAVHCDKGISSVQNKDIMPDDELPDFLLPDNTFKKMPIPIEGMAQNTEKILKVSLRDYQGLEGFSSSMSTTPELSDTVYRRLRKSRSDVSSRTRVDSLKRESLNEADSYEYVNVSPSCTGSLEEELPNMNRSVLNVEHHHHPHSSGGVQNNEESKSPIRNADVNEKKIMNTIGTQLESSTNKIGLVDETNIRRFDVHLQKQGNEALMSSTSESFKESHSLGANTKFVVGDHCNVMRKTSPKLSTTCIGGIRAESPVDSDYSLESHASSSVESRSPRDYDDDERKIAFPSNYFDIRSSLAASQTKQKVKEKHVQEVEEAKRNSPRKVSCQFSSKTVTKYDFQEAQHIVTSDIIECHAEESKDQYSANEDRKQQSSKGSPSGHDGSHCSLPIRIYQDQCSRFFSNQEKSQHGNQSTIVTSSQTRPSQQSKEKQIFVAKRQFQNDIKEAKVLVPHEAVLFSSSLTTCASNLQEMRPESLSHSLELQQSSEKKMTQQADGERKSLSVGIVRGSSCGSMSLLSRGETACIRDNVPAPSAHKSVIHRTVNVSQTASITNLTQAQSVASFSAPVINQPLESTTMVAQAKKDLKRD